LTVAGLTEVVAGGDAGMLVVLEYSIIYYENNIML